MKITDVKIRKLFSEGKVRAIVSIVIDEDFAVHDLKVIEGNERPFVAMPNRRAADGHFQDVAHPLNGETREMIEGTILTAYNRAVKEAARGDATGSEG